MQIDVIEKAMKASYQHEFGPPSDSIGIRFAAQRVRFVPRLGASVKANVENNRGTIFTAGNLTVGSEFTANVGMSNLISKRYGGPKQNGKSAISDIVNDVVVEGGEVYKSLRELREKVIAAAIAFKPVQGVVWRADGADAEIASILEEEKKLLTAMDAARTVLAATQPAATVAHARATFLYQEKVSDSLAMIKRKSDLSIARKAALLKALDALEVAMADYESIVPAFSREIVPRFAHLSDSLKTVFPDIGIVASRPHLFSADPMTSYERDVLSYVINGRAQGEQARIQQDELLMSARSKAQARGPAGISWDQLDVRFGRGRRKFAFLSLSAPYDSQIVQRDFDPVSLLATYSVELGGGGPSRVCHCVFGVSAGKEKRNNIGKLSTVDLREALFAVSTTPDSTGTTKTRIGEKSQKVYQGTLSQRYLSVFYGEIVWYPSIAANRIAIDITGRHSARSTAYPELEGGWTHGIGVALVKAGAPRQVIGGLNLSWVYGKKARLDAVLGYPF